VTNPLLLDTCAALWIAEDAPLDDEAAAALNAAGGDQGSVFISPITAWEIGLLVARGRLKTALTPLALYQAICGLPAMRSTVLSPEILIASSFLPGEPPRDPFDRAIIATAREHGLTVVTRDRAILSYAKDGHVLALAC
jgi:PIN domain nuclease of toxin-antitoxin system